MTLSQYEQQRLNNIAANNARLASLGLGGDTLGINDTVAKAAKRKTKPDDDDEDNVDNVVDALPKRRSGRVAKEQPKYGTLPEDFCRNEERLLDRPVRKRSAPQLYEQLQAQEIEARELAKMQRVEEKAREQAKQMRIQQGTAVTRSTWPQHPMTASMYLTAIPSGPKNQVRKQCPICFASFALNMDGSMRKHKDCFPPAAVQQQKQKLNVNQNIPAAPWAFMNSAPLPALT